MRIDHRILKTLLKCARSVTTKEYLKKALFSRDHMPCESHSYWLMIFRKSLFQTIPNRIDSQVDYFSFW
ncbi:hypothetical protein SAMN04244573_03440 [Azotobacter beijerinckii]|uniref:Uncharacterized protein n=1 Tax=Azotobacter beijerinckii TaxID=170623 RepID=A0A1H9NIE6_9GAMM|nr:hypothetical protein SAMN04244573_03440 [Azotobacter beijerinckii]